MVKEGRVHRFAHRVVAPEGKRDVGNAAAHFCIRQVFFDPARGFNERNRVAVVLLDTGPHGEDVGIENDVFGRKPDFFGQDSVSAGTNLLAPLGAVCLARLVKGHHHCRRAILPQEPGLSLEFLLAHLERDRVHDAFALHALEPRLQHAPFGTVDHDRDAGNVRLAGDQVQEMGHRRLRVDHPLVHVHVQDVRPALHLLAGDRERPFKIPGQDQFGKLRRAGDVRAFAHHQKAALGRDDERFEPAQARGTGAFRESARRATRNGFCNRPDVRGSRAAAAAHDVEPALRGPVADLHGERFGGLGKSGGRKRVGQSGVGITTHIHRGAKGQGFDVRAHLPGSKGAVEADA